MLGTYFKSISKILIGMGVGCVIPVIALMILILVSSVPQLTSLTIFYSRIPAILSSTYLDTAILTQDTLEAVTGLEKQGSYARVLGNNNLMRRQLVENTYMVYETITDPYDYLVLADWLEKLGYLLGDYQSYWFDLMNAHIAAIKNPANIIDLTHELTSIFPAFDRPYRPAIEAALNNSDYLFLKQLCNDYDNAKYNFLALNPYHKYRYRAGLYDASIILLPDHKTSGEDLHTHRAFLTEQFVPYEFRVRRVKETRSLRLSYRSLPGVRLKIKSIRFLTGQVSTVYSDKDLNYVGKYGFILDDGSYLLTDSMQSDVITFYPIKGFFPKSEVVVFYLQFEKLPIVKNQECL